MIASTAFHVLHTDQHAVTGGRRAPPLTLDAFDLRILEELQADASRSIAKIGEAVNLSQNACWRRIKHLEDEGVILGRVALVDARRVGVGVTVFATIRLAEHSEATLSAFAGFVRETPEVVELHRLSGEADYLVKVMVADLTAYDRVYRRLIRATRIANVSSSIAMETLKLTTAIPLGVPG